MSYVLTKIAKLHIKMKLFFYPKNYKNFSVMSEVCIFIMMLALPNSSSTVDATTLCVSNIRKFLMQEIRSFRQNALDFSLVLTC